MTSAELIKERRESAIKDFVGRHSDCCFDDKEKLESVLEIMLDNEIRRNKFEYRRKAENAFSNLVSRNQVHNIEMQGKEVEKEITEYFNGLVAALSLFEISKENMLIFKIADGKEIDGVVMPALYKIEEGEELPTIAGYYNLSEDKKKITAVYTEDKLNEVYFTNILDEEESYSYSPTLSIAPFPDNKLKSNGVGVSVLHAALKNYNDIKRTGKPESLSFIFPEEYNYDINKLIELGNKELSYCELTVCKTCGNVFPITQDERKHFMEELKLDLPKRCPTCRHIRRNIKKL